MTNSNYVKKCILAALFVALCVVFPMVFHTIPNGGSVLCPMHIPVMLCGFMCGGYLGVLCGILGPILSSVMTGMPSMAILPCMVVELAVYGFVTAMMMRLVHTKKIYADLYISLITSMICGKISAGIVKALFFTPNGYSMAIWAMGYFVTALPGIIIQLILIPSIIVSLEKAKLIPKRY